jgi:transcriptional regulator of acetoin/glycerol metabolism
MIPTDPTRLRERVHRQKYQGPERILQVVAAEILERHHQASAREIASLLLDAAGVEVGP